MFGLMKNKGCSLSDQPDWYRAHYCGTCKTLGQVYGQRSRMLLNYDVVFLAEILSLIQKEDTKTWDESINSYKCFSLPKENDIPLSLQYAADVNLLLAELKIADNAFDDSSELWNMANKFYQSKFSKLRKRIDQWGIDWFILEKWQKEGQKRENQVQDKALPNLNKQLDFCGESTAQVTAYLFAQGVKGIGSDKWYDEVYQTGWLFGQLIYELDAWKDYEQDIEEEKFNPLVHDNFFSDKQEIPDRLWKVADAICTQIDAFPFDENVKASLKTRLQLNLSQSLSSTVETCSPSTGIEKSTIPRLFSTASRYIREGLSWIDPARPGKFALSYLVFLAVFFAQPLIAVTRTLVHQPGVFQMNWTLLLSLSLPPMALYMLSILLLKKKKDKKFKRKMKRLERRLKRKLRRLERKEERKNKKIKWWGWVLIVLGALVLISLLSSGGSSDSCLTIGGGCGDCGGGCGDCGGGGSGSSGGGCSC